MTPAAPVPDLQPELSPAAVPTPPRPAATGRRREAWAMGGLALLTVGAVLAFVLPALRATHFEFCAPIDDAFIHAQYAKNFARGHLYMWSPDSGYSLGATSALYPVVLAVGWLIGFRDLWIMAFALLLNLAGWIVFLCATVGLARRSAPGPLPIILPLLLTINGSLLWSLGSGMEQGFCFGLLGFFLWTAGREWFAPGGAAPDRWMLLAAALLPLGRPDWLVLAAPILLGLLLRHRRRWGWRGAAWLLLIPFPFALYLGLNWLETGMALPNSASLKSLFHSPQLSGATKLGRFTLALTQQPVNFFDSNYSLWALKIAQPVLGLMGLLALWRTWRREPDERTLDVALLAAALLHNVVNASTWQSPRDCYRYYLVDFALLMLVLVRLAGAAWRVPRVGIRRSILRRFSRPLLRGAMIGALLLLLAGATPGLRHYYWRFGMDWRFFYEDHVAIGRKLAGLRQSDPRFKGRIVTHEAGIIPYLAGGDFYDLVGLCTNPGERLTDYFATDVPLFFEQLERESPERWPVVAIVLPMFNCLPFAGGTIFQYTLPKVYAENAEYNQMCDVLGVYRFPRELLGTGHQPPVSQVPIEWRRQGWRVRDRLDVADLASERAHAFRMDWPWEDAIRQTVFKAGQEDGRRVGDCGRRITVPTHWRLRKLAPDRPLLLLGRVSTLRVAAKVRLDLGDGRAREQGFAAYLPLQTVVLGRLEQAGAATLQMHLAPQLNNTLLLYQVWAVQPELPAPPSPLAAGSGK